MSPLVPLDPFLGVSRSLTQTSPQSRGAVCSKFTGQLHVQFTCSPVRYCRVASLLLPLPVQNLISNHSSGVANILCSPIQRGYVFKWEMLMLTPERQASLSLGKHLSRLACSRRASQPRSKALACGHVPPALGGAGESFIEAGQELNKNKKTASPVDIRASLRVLGRVTCDNNARFRSCK
jgi:hypothetical protein